MAEQEEDRRRRAGQTARDIKVSGRVEARRGVKLEALDTAQAEFHGTDDPSLGRYVHRTREDHCPPQSGPQPFLPTAELSGRARKRAPPRGPFAAGAQIPGEGLRVRRIEDLPRTLHEGLLPVQFSQGPFCSRGRPGSPSRGTEEQEKGR